MFVYIGILRYYRRSSLFLSYAFLTLVYVLKKIDKHYINWCITDVIKYFKCILYLVFKYISAIYLVFAI